MLLVALALAAPCPAPAPEARVHLVTVAPGGDLFSSMGHTALVFTGDHLRFPVAFDWGAYDPKQATVERFLRGELVYFLNRRTLEAAAEKWAGQDRLAVLQTLEVPPEEVIRLHRRLEAQSQPESRDYEYHWATANCATKARDVLDALSGGALARQLDRPVDTTARFEALRHLHRWPIPGFAWQATTGPMLDRPLSAWERTMLPEHLMREVDGVEVGGRPWVTATCELTTGGYGWAPATPPPRWPFALPGLLGSAAVLGAAKAGWTRTVGLLTAAYGVTLASLGTVGFGLWALGGMDGIGPSHAWLAAGPQTWLLAGVGLAAMARRAGERARRIAVGLAGLAAAALPLGAIPGFPATLDVLAALVPGSVACAVAVSWVTRPR